MPAFTFVASKAQPEGFEGWTAIPGAGDRAVFRIQNDKFNNVDNVFVVDANEDMAEHWDDMTADAAQIGDAGIRGDSDGMDIFFAGVESDEAEDDDSPAGGFLNVYNPLFLQEAFQKIKAAGFASEEALAATIARIFAKYLANYNATADKSKIKSLNMIVWTDGTFSQEAFEATLVRIAKDLEAVGAPKTQVGIQLFRVGNVDGVAEKFDYYDNDLKDAHGLDRDLVDHRAYTPNGLTETLIAEVFFGALDKDQDNA